MTDAEFLKSKGWSQCYDADYWIHPELTGKLTDCTYCGWSTLEAKRYEEHKEFRKEVIEGFERHEAAVRALSNLAFSESEEEEK